MGRTANCIEQDSDVNPNSQRRYNLFARLASGTSFAAKAGIPFVEVEMNALDLLTDDHQKVKRLFEQAQQIQDNQQKKEMFDKIDMELAIHADIEETIFYPALEEHDPLKEMVREASQEHEAVEQLLLEIEDLATEDTDFSSQLVELEKTVDDHVAEEEGEMFPKIREIFDDETLEALGKKLESARGKQFNVSKSDLRIA